eukprot:1828279-Amphidinium_carterae.1
MKHDIAGKVRVHVDDDELLERLNQKECGPQCGTHMNESQPTCLSNIFASRNEAQKIAVSSSNLKTHAIEASIEDSDKGWPEYETGLPLHCCYLCTLFHQSWGFG